MQTLKCIYHIEHNRKVIFYKNEYFSIITSYFLIFKTYEGKEITPLFVLRQCMFE